jgi:N-acetylglucosamine kinase-like BadF-type ATPase
MNSDLNQDSGQGSQGSQGSADESYVVGLDAGGTRTRAVLAPARGGDPCGEGVAGPGNALSVPVPELTDHLTEALTHAVPEVLRGRVVAVAGGFAGASRTAADEPGRVRAHSALTAALHRLGIDAASVEIYSDIEAAFASAPGHPADGLALVAGTGAVAARITGRRCTATAGGDGWLLGDDGSGFWLGREAVRAALRMADGRGAPTALAASVGRELGVPEEVLPGGREAGPPERAGRLYGGRGAGRPRGGGSAGLEEAGRLYGGGGAGWPYGGGSAGGEEAGMPCGGGAAGWSHEGPVAGRPYDGASAARPSDGGTASRPHRGGSRSEPRDRGAAEPRVGGAGGDPGAGAEPGAGGAAGRAFAQAGEWTRALREAYRMRLLPAVMDQPPVRLARLAPLVAEAARDKDAVAEGILAEAAEHLVGTVSALRPRPGERVVATGGLLGPDGPLTAPLTARLRPLGLTLDWVADGSRGAVALARLDF